MQVRRAPASFVLDYWQLLHPLPSLLTVLAAGAFVLLAAHGMPSPGRLLLLLVVETSMQFSISAANDYFDRKIDQGRSDKPVAAGRITPANALALGMVLGVLSILLAMPLGTWVALLTAIGLAGGLLYDAGLKYTILSWLPFCVAFPTLPLWGWAGAHPDLPFPPGLLWTVPVAAILVLGIHLADTLPDLAGDTAAGVRGLAHRLGLRNSLLLCRAAFIVAPLLTLFFSQFLPYTLQWYLPALLLDALLLLASILLQSRATLGLKGTCGLLQAGALIFSIGWIAAILD